jgi:hypothetical protein
LDWLKKGKLWYFALWVFVMSPITMGLYFTSETAAEQSPPRQQGIEPETSEERLRFSRTAQEETTTIGNVPFDSTESKVDEMRHFPPRDAFLKECGRKLGKVLGSLFSGKNSNSIAEKKGTVPPSPLDILPTKEDDEDYDAMRERILAKERAKELALIEEERKFVPLVDAPDKLIPADPLERIWVTPDMKSVVLTGRVVLREGFLELLACRVGSKEHESILSVRVHPWFVHAALLVVGAEQGKPMQTSPVYVPATGDKIDITLRWKDESGKQQESRAQDWIWDMSVSKEDAKKPMTTHWVFSGSKEIEDDDGKIHYLANETGELFGLSNFAGSIMDVPIRSTDDDTELQFGCFTERIPPKDTLVTIILTPAR